MSLAEGPTNPPLAAGAGFGSATPEAAAAASAGPVLRNNPDDARHANAPRDLGPLRRLETGAACSVSGCACGLVPSSPPSSAIAVRLPLSEDVEARFTVTEAPAKRPIMRPEIPELPFRGGGGGGGGAPPPARAGVLN